MKKERTLLIDGDIFAYKCAMYVEEAVEIEDGYWTWHCNVDAVKEGIENQIALHMKKLKASSYKIALTDYEHNFRLDVSSDYKGNRSSVKKPLALKEVRRWLLEEKDAWLRPGLEGDDILGILATVKSNEERVIVSLDKDLKTIPGIYCRSLDDGLVRISEEQADKYHLYQTLMGDITDGYTGCPGVGSVKATEVVSNPLRLLPVERQVLRGVRKGELITEWKEGDECSIWEAVVSHFEKAGLTEEDAIKQARLARILRASDYDFKNKKPILWKPPIH